MAKMRKPSLQAVLVIAILLLISAWYRRIYIQRQQLRLSAVTVSSLPPELEAIAVSQFDELVKRKVVAYQDSAAELFEKDGFQWEFRQVPSLRNKPIPPPPQAGRTPETTTNPFAHPDPEIIITAIGPTHHLLINAYPIYRPSFLLATKAFEPQSSDLTPSDITAVWAVLKTLKGGYLATFNKGANAGSSQPHKHLQIFPLPETGDTRLWPAKAGSTEHINSHIPGVPFRHSVLRLRGDASAEYVFSVYGMLLAKTREALADFDAGGDYNVVMTRDWIATVPRRSAAWGAIGGPGGQGAEAMLGLVSVPGQEGRDEWAQRGYTRFLIELGVNVGEER